MMLQMGKSCKSERKSKKDKGKGMIEETTVTLMHDEQNPAGPVAGQSQNYSVLQTPDKQDINNMNVQEDLAETLNAGHQYMPGATKDTATVENQGTLPSTHEQWDMMKAMMAQVAVLTQTLAQSPVMQVEEKQTRADMDLIEISLRSSSARKRGDYLSLLEHVSKLRTRHFTGSLDPIVADEYKSRLDRNFNSTRCPEDYQKDITVHFLKGDAHNWWLTVEKRKSDQI